MAKNVLGTDLQSCCLSPVTGFYRDGTCNTGQGDLGVHVICAQMTEDFLRFAKARGNDLTTPRSQWGFPGLKPGDHWCLCASRFLQAHDEGCAPVVNAAATHMRALEIVPMQVLERYFASTGTG